MPLRNNSPPPETSDSSEERLSAGASASSGDVSKPAAKKYASSSGGTAATATATSTAQSSTSSSPSPAQASKKRKEHHEHNGQFSLREPFLDKLRLMLDNETNLDSGSIQWLDGEDAFVILDQNKFEKDIIPKYFTPIIFQSFLRKLYRWGFKRITTSHAGNYKFASATFTRRPVPSAASQDAAGPSGIAFGAAGQIPFQQAAAVHAQPNQLIPLLAQLQQSLQPPVQPQPGAQYNEFGTLLANAISRQQQSQQVLQQMLVQQIVNQIMLNSAPSNAFAPALNQYVMSTFGAPSQDPLVSFLNQNQSLNPYAPPVRTLPSSEQALALLTRNIQNAATAANGTNQNSGNALDASERSSATVTAEPRVMLPPSQPDSSSEKTQSKRKRKH